ncbi:MAG TPA: SprT-like domain-containing protein [Pyrinomonadaceae bacterium]|nr:SprT-like domain-containing protein [Pyrinomonadaceae bacterium]
MAADTKVFQDIADAMLPLFDNMPQVVVLVEDNAVFHQEPFPAAVYSSPNIIINPPYARTCSFDQIQDTICHELIHAWLEWKGLLGTGEFLDEHHSELFVKKALEINKNKLANVTVDVDYLLSNTKAVDVYNRVAGIRYAPYMRHKVRKITKTIAAYASELVEIFWENARRSKAVVVSFSIIVITLVLTKARLIPDGVASYVWIGWAVVVLVWHAVVMIRQRTR